MRLIHEYAGWVKKLAPCDTDTWRDPKVISPPQ